MSEFAPVGAVDDDGESGETAASHNHTVEQHVHNNLPGENTNLDVVRRASHNLSRRLLLSETESRERGRKHVDPEDLKRGEGKDGSFAAILESETDTEEEHFSDVGDEKMENKLRTLA